MADGRARSDQPSQFHSSFGVVCGSVLLASGFCAALIVSEPFAGLKAKPSHAAYADPAAHIPDAEFVRFAENFVQLIATYGPERAEQQFRAAAPMLAGKARESFDRTMLKTELRSITDTKRTQSVALDPTGASVARISGADGSTKVMVVLQGIRHKRIGAKRIPDTAVTYAVQLAFDTGRTPGIVIEDVQMQRYGTAPDPVHRAAVAE